MSTTSRCHRLTGALAALLVLCTVNNACVAKKNSNTTPVINVEVYYESLCPDSIYFITKELAPAYKDLKDFMNVMLVPFGKASWVLQSDNRPEFTCQHGPRECRGNRAQACALHQVELELKAEDRQHVATEIVDCVMSSRDPASAVPQCAEKLGFEKESIGNIQSCSNSNVGDELLIMNGEKTKAFESPLTFVPSIVINGEKNSAAFRNFKSVICGKIPDHQKPASCTPSS